MRKCSVYLLQVVCFTVGCAGFQLSAPYTSSLYLHPPQSKLTSLTSSSTSDNNDYDLAVIGAGPVGVKAALNARSTYNKRVVLIDAPRESGVLYDEVSDQDLSIGGPTGLFSKALRDTSKRIRVDSLRGMGLREENIWNEVTSACIDLARLNSNDVFRQLEFLGVDYISGFCSFPQSGNTDELVVTQPNTNESQIVKVKDVLLATGSRPFRPQGIPFDGQRIFDSDTVNTLGFLPKTIAITGSGIIAVEYAKIFRNLGSEVTLIIRDFSPRNALMKIGLDKDVAATLVADLVRSGINIEKGAQVKSFDVPKSIDASLVGRTPIKLELEAKGGGDRSSCVTQSLKVDAYLAAVGRIPNTANLNLEAAGIEVDDYGGLLVDSEFRTTAQRGNVYGAGDVLGRPFLASTGVAQAAAAIQSLYNTEKESSIDISYEDDTIVNDFISSFGSKFDPKSLANNPFAFPTGIWSSPEAAYYGLSKQQAEEIGISDVGEGIALYSECLRGLVFQPNGLLKLVYEKPEGRILGVHICGDDACELIHYGMELVKTSRTIRDLVNSLYSAVTYHEMYHIAALAAIDEKGGRRRRAAAGRALAARNRAMKK